MLTFGATSRGFGRIAFTDRNGQACSLQESSLATDDCVWLGCDEINLKRFEPGIGWSDVQLHQDTGGIAYVANTRMHLTREMVAALLPVLTHFVKTGGLPEGA